MNVTQISKFYNNLKIFGNFVEDLKLVDKNIENLYLSPKAKNFYLLHTFTKLKRLYIGAVGSQTRDETFQEICKVTSLTYLGIKWLQVKDITPLKNLKHLEYLSIGSNSKATDIRVLGTLTTLKGLSLTDFQKVHNIAPLSNLTELEELAIEGGMWKTMKIETITPLRKLTKLKILCMTSTRILDDSFKVLAELPTLEYLSFGNYFPYQDVAFLKFKLKNTYCQWFKPVFEIHVISCKKCGANKAMLTGKRGLYCLQCDSQKIQDFLKAFNAIASTGYIS